MSVVVLEQELLKSEVFRSLNGTSIVVFMDFRMRCKMWRDKKGKKRADRAKSGWVILNNGKLVYTYAEAEKMEPPITRSTFMRALDELIGKGFIDVTHSGNAGRKGDVNLYAISERWRQYGTPQFKKETRPKDQREGRGFALMWKRKRAQSSVLQMNTETATLYPKTNTETQAWEE